jgi:hypothetical protein
MRESCPNLELQLKKNVNAAPQKKRSWLKKLSMTLSLSHSLESDDAKLAAKSQMSDLSSITKETGSIEYSNLSKEGEAVSSVSESDKVESNSSADSSVGSLTSESKPEELSSSLQKLSMTLSLSSSLESDDAKLSTKSQKPNLSKEAEAFSSAADSHKVKSYSPTDSSVGSSMSENDPLFTVSTPGGLSGEVFESKSLPRTHVGVSHSLCQTDNLNPVFAAQSDSDHEGLALELGLSGEVFESKSWPKSHVGVSHSLSQAENLNPVLAAQSGSAEEDSALELAENIPTSHSTTNVECVPDNSEDYYMRPQSPSLRVSITTGTESIVNSSLSSATLLSTSIENSSLSTETYTSVSVSDINESTTSEYSSEGFSTSLSTPQASWSSDCQLEIYPLKVLY